MSARWRRKRKDSERHGFFKTFSKPNEGIDSNVLRSRGSWAKRKTLAEKACLKIRLPEGKNEPKPLVDVLENDDEVVVVAEIAGFSRESIKTNVKDQRLTLSAHASDRKYYKSLNLPRRVIPTTMRTAYKNGVLEIRLKKVNGKKTIRSVVN